MHIIIAPNAFKGSLSAEDAAQCISSGFRRSNLSCKLTLFPVADGGDDTISLLIKGMKGESVSVSVHDPLGRMISARLGWVAGEKKALIGVSDASGLRLLKREELDPFHANSFGTGELIKAALDRGARKLVIAAGGSATIDGATGSLKALGVRFLDGSGNEIHDLPADLLQLKAIDTGGLDSRLASCEITVLCDVENRLLGKNGAVAVYGPQKGADKKKLVLLEKCLYRWKEIVYQIRGVDMALLPSGGAAGGIAAGLAVFTHAKLVNGIGFFLDDMHFDLLLQRADLVITAEGSIDDQTLAGKGPFGVARRAKAKGIPVIGLAGHIPSLPGKEMSACFDQLLSINPVHASLQEAMSNTASNLTRTACELGNLLALEQAGDL